MISVSVQVSGIELRYLERVCANEGRSAESVVREAVRRMMRADVSSGVADIVCDYRAAYPGCPDGMFLQRAGTLRAADR